MVRSGSDTIREWFSHKATNSWPLLLFLFLILLALIALRNQALEYFVALPIGIISIYLFIRDPRVRFGSTLLVIMLLQVFETAVFLQYIAAAIFNGGLFIVIFDRKLRQNRSVTPSALLLPFSLFLVWGISFGLINFVLGGTTFEQWYREVLIWAPLFLFPIYYQDIVEQKLNPEKFLKWAFVLLWISVFLASFYKIRHNIVQAVYLFQIGSARYDTINGAFMMFIIFALSMIEDARNRILLLFAFLFSVCSLILTFGRTAWIASVMCTPIVLYFGNKVERKNGIKFIWLLLIASVVFSSILYTYDHRVKLAFDLFWSKLASVSFGSKDASMYNRYIEWDGLLTYVKNIILTGGGFGANFKNYDWLLGIVYQAKYTHSAYLGVILKSGIVGFILLFIPVVAYVIKGVALLDDVRLTSRERAYIRAGIATMCYTAIIATTGNVFYQREMMMYIGFYWSYCIGIEYKLNQLDKSTIV